MKPPFDLQKMIGRWILLSPRPPLEREPRDYLAVLLGVEPGGIWFVCDALQPVDQWMEKLAPDLWPAGSQMVLFLPFAQIGYLA